MGEITVIGVGLGNKALLTIEAAKVIARADILIGAARLLDDFAEARGQKITAYAPKEIAQMVARHEGKNIAVLVSGDVGFYSGAQKLSDALRPYHPRFLCGISSLQYLCAQVPTAWHDVEVVSLHGRDNGFLGVVQSHEKTFLLLDPIHTVNAVCAELVSAQLTKVTVTVGERLSYAEERIVTADPQTLLTMTFAPLAVVLIFNPEAKQPPASAGIADELFTRSTVPMTKSEVRAVCIGKLQLNAASIVYDIGAGTCSVTVETALQTPCGHVYAIERKDEAVELIKENCRLFGVHNVTIIKAQAPEGLAELPPPDGVFIGGSGGNLEAIVEAVLAKNPQAQLVITAITLETLAQAVNICKSRCTQWEAIQLTVSRNRPVGALQLMQGQNPVFILSGRGCGHGR